MIVEIGADLGGDGETRRDGEADSGHFGQIGPFASQEGLHLAVSIGFAVTKEVDVFNAFADRGFAGLLGLGLGFGGHG
jgi:hypothetical protein